MRRYFDVRLEKATLQGTAHAGVTLVWPPPYGLPELSRAANDGTSEADDR